MSEYFFFGAIIGAAVGYGVGYGAGYAAAGGYTGGVTNETVYIKEIPDSFATLKNGLLAFAIEQIYKGEQKYEDTKQNIMMEPNADPLMYLRKSPTILHDFCDKYLGSDAKRNAFFIRFYMKYLARGFVLTDVTGVADVEN